MDAPDPFDLMTRLDELEAPARLRMDLPAYDYYAGGANDEWTLAENRRAFDRWVLRPRYLVDVAHIDLATTVLGQPMPFPMILAPTAFHRLAHAEGEVATARGAAAAGATLCVSTSATMPLADIMATGVPAWFQLYVHEDRGISQEMVRMAVDAGCRALVLTVDVPHLGLRERDVKNDMDAWFPEDIQMDNLVSATAGTHPGSELFDPNSLFFDASLSWRDLEWLRGLSELPVVIKGVMTAEDASLAVEHGADAVVVSNHGGRQLDHVSATIDALPEVVDAVAGRIEVLVDGGFRRGTDVVTALALGARAVMIGRPYLWGLAVGGDRGVRWVIEKLRGEIELAMALTGADSVGAIVSSMVAPAPGSRR